MVRAMTTKQLNSMKVAELRSELRVHGLKVSGVKQELVERLAKYFKSAKSQLSTDGPSAAMEIPASKQEGMDSAIAPSETEIRCSPADEAQESPGDPSVLTADLSLAANTDSNSVAEKHECNQSEISTGLLMQMYPSTAEQFHANECQIAEHVAEVMPSGDDSQAHVQPTVEVSHASELDDSRAHDQPTVEASHASVTEATLPCLKLITDPCPPHATVSVSMDVPAPDAVSSYEAVAPNCMEETGTDVPSQSPAEFEKPRDASVPSDTPPRAPKHIVKAESSATVRPPSPKAFQTASNGDRDQPKPKAAARRSQPVRHVMASSPLSPNAVLAQEVTAPEGTPSKEDSTPVKSAHKMWRDLCAREAARLRIGSRKETSQDSAATDQPTQESSGEPSNSSTLGQLESNVRTVRYMSRSRSPRGTSPPTQRPKIILRRRRSLLQKSPGMSTSTPSRRRAVSRSRSPVSSRAQTATPRNCLFKSTPKHGSPNILRRTPTGVAARSENASVAVTPQELRARIRAEELRKELLKKVTPKASMPSHTPVETPRSAISSLVANFAPPSPAEATTPRNLASALQDAADDLSTGTSRHQLAHSKRQMLEQLTEQMQKCLARVHDPHLDDACREKYQTLASSIGAQLEKIGSIRPAGSTAARGGC
jgi:hypothetical protein